MRVSSVRGSAKVARPMYRIGSTYVCQPFPNLGIVKNILKYDGVRGMYRGLGPTILGYLPTWAIYFAVYDTIKDYFGKKSLGDVEGVRHVLPAAQAKGYQPLSREHPWTLHLFSAMAAGATSTLCTNPLWVIKTRFMVRTPFLFNVESPGLSGVRRNRETSLDTDIRSMQSRLSILLKVRVRSLEDCSPAFWASHMLLYNSLCTSS